MKKLPLLACFVSVALVGCAELTYPINQTGVLNQTDRRFQYKVAPPTQTAAPEEDSYIKSRRKAAGVPANQPVFGVAFSGGGVRSATVCLGVLQGLEEKGLLNRADYLSCVSGGGYTGSWYISHLRTQAELNKITADLGNGDHARTALANFSTNRADLLEIKMHSDCKAVKNLRDRGGLFGNWGRIGQSATWWLSTLVPNAVMDLGLHFEPLPGKSNAFHPFYAYRERLTEYYLQGWDAVTDTATGTALGGNKKEYLRPSFADDVNGTGSQTPYFISNGALANSARQDTDGDGKDTYISDTHGFEFTRDRCGSPLIGWVPTAQFDRPVASVKHSASGAEGGEVLAGPVPFARTAPLPLSTAMATSGAAIDSAGIGGLKTKLVINYLLGAVNLNLRYQTANPTMNHTPWYERPADRLREVTTDRFLRAPRSNTLQISDGGHHENLGVYALLRRDVPNILAIDASQDKKYTYSELRSLLLLVQKCGWQYECDGIWTPQLSKEGCRETRVEGILFPKQFNSDGKAPANPLWVFKVKKPNGAICRVLYAKNSWRDTDLADPQSSDLRGLTTTKKELQPPFPHIGTFQLEGWIQPRFDAYRDNGRLLARRAAGTVATWLSAK